MKSSRASVFLKNVISVLSSITKSKSMAIKSKAEALKERVIMLSLLKGKRIHTILRVGSHKDDNEDDDISSKAKELNSSANMDYHHQAITEDDYYYYYHNGNDNGDDYDIKYPDLRHCLFDEEEDDELNPINASVIDQVKNSMEQDGEDFKLEDEIDHVADLFITKFHKRMKLQKLQSFKRYQEMLARGAA